MISGDPLVNQGPVMIGGNGKEELYDELLHFRQGGLIARFTETILRDVSKRGSENARTPEVAIPWTSGGP